MGLFSKVFTNLFWDGEVAGRTPDCQGDYYLATDAQADHEYLQEKVFDTVSSISGQPTTDFMILFGGRISDAGSGKINITEGVVKTYDTNSNKRLVHIPALNNVSLPSGWNDGRSIWVTARYDFKLGASTRNHKAGPSYHYQIQDTYMGDSNGYISTTTDDLFTTSDPSATAAILGKFTMTGTTFADLNVRSPEFPIIDPSYDYVVDSQGKFDLMVAHDTWFNATNVLFTCNVSRSEQTIIPSTVQKIHAINGATLTVTGIGGGQPFGIAYGSIPISNEYEIIGLTVSASGSSNSYGFGNCLNVINCTSSATDSSGQAIGFTQCKNLKNCVASATGTVSSYAFNLCNYLQDCNGYGEVNGGGGSGSGYGFRDCNYLQNCDGLGTGDNHSEAFYNCDYLINCSGTADTKQATGFYECEYLVNCKATCHSTTGYSAHGFWYCNYLVNCNSHADASSGSVGTAFDCCDQITNCTGIGFGGSSYGYVFSNCDFTNGCKKSGTPTTAMWNGTNNYRDDQSCETS